MKKRNEEASRLEKDYLDRLDKVLERFDPAEAVDVRQGVRDHIEEAAAEAGGEEITLVQMAEILEKLGSPEEFTPEDPAGKSPVPETQPEVPRNPEVDFEFLRDLLGTLWMALFVGILGLFIPLISLHITSIISGIMLLGLLKKNSEKQPKSFRSAYIFALLMLISYFVLCGVSTLTLIHKGFAILGLFIIPLPILDVIVYWKLMNGLIAICGKLNRNDIIDSINMKKGLYIVWTGIIFIFGIILGLSNLNPLQIDLVSYLILPLGWLFGWFLVLRPVTMTREAINGEEGNF